jgi:hypothetical protein
MIARRDARLAELAELARTTVPLAHVHKVSRMTVYRMLEGQR